MQHTTRKFARRRGFTLVQLVVVLGITSMLATLIFSAFSDGRAAARRAQCDARLKTIALALDAFRQESRLFPASLQELRTKRFLHDDEDLHCPSDPRDNGTYGDFYMIRAAQDDPDYPTVTCPFHESTNGQGAQAFKGKYTKQFFTRPALLEQASGVTVEHPGQAPVAALSGMTLRGGDRIRTASSGAAIIRFADNSTTELQGDSDMTVLQSFVASTSNGPLYTVVRQTLGTILYRVNHGSKFDVATPTATAGALGTVFRISVNSSGIGTLTVLDSKVYLSTLKSHIVADTGTTVPVTGLVPQNAPGLSPNPTPTAVPTATPTPLPTATPTPSPTATPTVRPTATPTPRPTATPTPRPTPTPTRRPTPTPTPCNRGHGHGHGSGAC